MNSKKFGEISLSVIMKLKRLTAIVTLLKQTRVIADEGWQTRVENCRIMHQQHRRTMASIARGKWMADEECTLIAAIQVTWICHLHMSVIMTLGKFIYLPVLACLCVCLIIYTFPRPSPPC